MTTPNGWTQESVFTHWIRECLIPQLNKLRKPGEKALLIFDGHQSHESEEAVQLALKNDIEFVRLPSHTTHKLQPLDVGIFGPIQAAWRKQTKDYTLKAADELPLSQVVREYLTARTRVMKESNIVSAWKKSGLLGLDPNSFGAGDYGPAQLTSTNAFLPPSYPQKAFVDFDIESEVVSESPADTPSTPISSSDKESESDLTDATDQTPFPHPYNEPVEPGTNASPSSSSSNLAQPTAGTSRFPGSCYNPIQPRYCI